MKDLIFILRHFDEWHWIAQSAAYILLIALSLLFLTFII